MTGPYYLDGLPDLTSENGTLRDGMDGRGSTRRPWTVETLAGFMEDERQRLGRLAMGELGVRASFSLNQRLRRPAVPRTTTQERHAFPQHAGTRQRRERSERSVGGRSHSDSTVGSMVRSATVTSSAERVSRSTWSRRRALNASTVLAAW
jgi:hypothetical protein